MIHVGALLVGFVLDLLVGDPRWMPHPIRAIGALIEMTERFLRRAFPATPVGERAAGVVLVVVVAGISTAITVFLLWACYRINLWFGFTLETLLCFFMLATRSLRDESTHVATALKTKGLHAARRAVSMIVGRDTENLDEAGVVRATVETVAENTCDGVVAPILFMAIGGAPAGVLYKAVNTMDSMVGYKNDRYQYFGTAAARLDDIFNFVPARISGLLMCAMARFVGLDAAGAWRIFGRDCHKHASPNSAHTEAACAGALGVQLAGPASYFGKVKEKPFIGDDTRPIEVSDIARVNKLMLATAVSAVLISSILMGVIYRIM